MVEVRELIGWDLDESMHREVARALEGESGRERLEVAWRGVAERLAWVDEGAFDEAATAGIAGLLERQRGREDLLREMEGLAWEMGVVDLRRLVAFQRRVVLGAGLSGAAVPGEGEWEGLVGLAFGAAREARYEVREEGAGFWVRSENPDLRLRLRRGDGDGSPIEVYGGSPFFEVAEFRGRWFLRDGYHRAYALMAAGVSRMPAVMVRARSMEEVGATKPWFFGEGVLFSERPPRVMDFLDDAMCVAYRRPGLVKTLRVDVTETMSDDVNWINNKEERGDGR